MSFLDIILGAFLIYGFFRGLLNGFFVELASLIALFIGIFVAIKFSYLMKNLLENHVHWSAKHIQITAFILTFILVVIGILLSAKFFTTIANFANLGLINKLLGGVFGFIRMILILSILLNLFQKVNVNHTFAKRTTLEKSLIFYPILKIATLVYPTLEDWFKDIKKMKV
ncbi:MAG: CvpA family protein [Flavobacterium sp.]|nr:CvpA family protein [Flavobacterium sp.]